MRKSDQATKRLIMDAATQLIREHGDASKITVRHIAAKANIGVGLVNYHFQTKENLISQCVQRIIGQVIDRFEPLEKSLEMEPFEKLKQLARLNAKFLAENPGLSRISITSDLLWGDVNDNSSQTAQAYLKFLKKCYGGRKSCEELGIMFHILISSIQVAFLRHEVMKETGGVDFFADEQRDKYVDDIVGRVFHDLVAKDGQLEK